MYAELHCHSAYSFMDGASLPEELARQAEALGYAAVALTDHDGLYGAMEFAQQAKARGLQAITGAEVTLEDGSHLTLLAETPTGYANLCRLISRAHQENERRQPRIALERLSERAEGLIALSGCREGPVARAVDQGDHEAARQAARRFREVFGPESFFIELQQTLVYGDTARRRVLAQLAAELEMPVVATNNVHYHVPERHQLQDALVAARHRLTLDESHRQRRANREFHLKAPEEMARLFAGFPEALANTERIAERCAAFDITRDLGYTFPDFQREGDESADEALARICRHALRQRYARETPFVRAEAARRLETELAIVQHHRLAGFFLVYRDLMLLAEEVAARVRGQTARSRFALAPGRGRGSSVSSVICYLIGLSPVDPVRARLSLGRFLNMELASVPDVDLDFPRDIREELIRAVHRRYGAEHVAMVASFPTYRIRSAIRDLGLALGLPPADIDRLSRLSEGGHSDTVEEELRRLPGFPRAGVGESGRVGEEECESRGAAEYGKCEEQPLHVSRFTFHASQTLWAHLIRLARELRGFPRHLSQHPGGLIISSRPLVELVPVEHSRMEGRLVCQWDKDSCDDARFIKIDFLSLGMLSAVEESLCLIEDNGKPPVDLSRVNFWDPAVYDKICAADTVGVFQIESRAQMQMLPRSRPRNLADLSVEVAIVRPGPIIGGAINPYLRARERRRRSPRAPIVYDHPCLEKPLAETLGAILFQDQVLEVCQAMAGFTVGRAEAFRRAMSRRRSLETMEAFRQEFLEGARGNGVPPEVASRVFDKLLGFSAYGFPKSHAMAFAILAYQSTWLAHYHPAEFVAALLNNQPMGFYSRDTLVKDAQRHGVRFLRPSINESQARCTVSGEAVRLGLLQVDGVGEKAVDAILAARQRGGKFRSLPDFARRVPLPVRLVENLILAGAFQQFGLHRRLLLWQLGLLARSQGSLGHRVIGSWGHCIPYHPTTRRSGDPTTPIPRTSNLKPQTFLPLPTRQDMVPLPRMTPWENLVADYRTLDLSPQGHPLGLLRPLLPKGLVTAAHLAQVPPGKTVWMAGIVVARQRPPTAKGVLFLLLEDETGMANAIVSPQLYEERRSLLRGEPLLWLRGHVQRQGGVVNLILADAGSLVDALNDRHPGDAPTDDPALAFLHDLRRAVPPVHQWR